MNYGRKVVLITGGTGGLGLAFGKAFLDKGSKVCLADVEEKKEFSELEKTFGKDKVSFCRCDVTKEKDFLQAFKNCETNLGSVNILINNAAIFNEQNFDQVLDVNLSGTFIGCETAMKILGKHNGGTGGHVINVASLGGIVPFSTSPFYSASKAGIVHYTRCLGMELHYNYSGIKFLCLCPSYTNTPLFQNARPTENAKGYYNEVTLKASMEMRANISVLGTEDVANALFKLLEEERNGGVMIKLYDKEPFYAKLISGPIEDL